MGTIPNTVPTGKGTHKVRLRCGSAERVRFVIYTPSKPVADARALRMQNVAAACVRVGMPLAETLVCLNTLAEVASEAEFAKCERRALAEAQQQSAAPDAPAKPVAYTFGQVSDLWLNGDLTRQYPHKVPAVDPHTAKKYRGRIAAMSKVLGRVALADVTEDLADQAIAALPADMADTTRAQHQSLIRRVMSIAVKIGRIKTSPIPRGWCGSVKSKRTNSFLYPPEDEQLLACQAIEFAYRLLWGFLAREGCRLDEALDATWAQVDLVRGAFRIDKHKSRKKTGKSRHWVMEPGTTRALKWVFFELQRQGKAKPHMRVFAGLENLNERTAAALLRDEHLKLAGIDRPELFEDNAERMWFHVHSLRWTFVTLALANKRSEHEIMSKTGHATSAQLQDYDAGASLVRVMGFTNFLAPLDVALGLTEGVQANDGAGTMGGPTAGSAAEGDHAEQAGGTVGPGAAAAGLEALRDGLRSDGVNARGLGRDNGRQLEAGLADLVAGSGGYGALSGAGAYRGDGMNQPGTGVGHGVGQNSRTSINMAGPWGLLQTPVAENGTPGSTVSADLRAPECRSVQLGPPASGGMGQNHPGQSSLVAAPDAGQIPDAETALANAAAGAVAAGQWGLAKAFVALLEERQRARQAADGVIDLESRRAKATR